jgi:predicted amidohydrolase YtcJ
MLDDVRAGFVHGHLHRTNLGLRHLSVPRCLTDELADGVQLIKRSRKYEGAHGEQFEAAPRPAKEATSDLQQNASAL